MTDPGLPDPHRAPTPPPPPPPPPGSMAPPPFTAPPAGYTPYVGGGSLSSVRGVGKALVAVSVIGIVLTLASLAVQLSLVGTAEDFLDGIITEAAFEDETSLYGALGALAALATIVQFVVAIVWSYRIAGNLQKLGRAPTWKPGLAIVAWVLGFCTFGITSFLMLREHWKASDPELQPGDPQWRDRAVSPLIAAWLALTVLSAIPMIAVGLASGNRMLGGLADQDSTRTAAEAIAEDVALTMTSGLVGVVATLVLIMIVGQLTERHTRATERA